MGKKQTRVNRGARTGGHEHRTATTAETKEQAKASARPERERPIPEPAQRKQPKFGHN